MWHNQIFHWPALLSQWARAQLCLHVILCDILCKQSWARAHWLRGCGGRGFTCSLILQHRPIYSSVTASRWHCITANMFTAMWTMMWGYPEREFPPFQRKQSFFPSESLESWTILIRLLVAGWPLTAPTRAASSRHVRLADHPASAWPVWLNERPCSCQHHTSTSTNQHRPLCKISST